MSRWRCFARARRVVTRNAVDDICSLIPSRCGLRSIITYEGWSQFRATDSLPISGLVRPRCEDERCGVMADSSFVSEHHRTAGSLRSYPGVEDHQLEFWENEGDALRKNKDEVLESAIVKGSG